LGAVYANEKDSGEPATPEMRRLDKDGGEALLAPPVLPVARLRNPLTLGVPSPEGMSYPIEAGIAPLLPEVMSANELP
jgi:hypothetical protein